MAAKPHFQSNCCLSNSWESLRQSGSTSMWSGEKIYKNFPSYVEPMVRHEKDMKVRQREMERGREKVFFVREMEGGGREREEDSKCSWEKERERKRVRELRKRLQIDASQKPTELNFLRCITMFRISLVLLPFNQKVNIWAKLPRSDQRVLTKMSNGSERLTLVNNVLVILGLLVQIATSRSL